MQSRQEDFPCRLKTTIEVQASEAIAQTEFDGIYGIIIGDDINVVAIKMIILPFFSYCCIHWIGIVWFVQ